MAFRPDRGTTSVKLGEKMLKNAGITLEYEGDDRRGRWWFTDDGALRRAQSIIRQG